MKYFIASIILMTGVFLGSSVYAALEFRLGLNDSQVGIVLNEKTTEYTREGVIYETWKGYLFKKNKKIQTTFTLWHKEDFSRCAINSQQHIADLVATSELCEQIFSLSVSGSISLIADISTGKLVIAGYAREIEFSELTSYPRN